MNGTVVLNAVAGPSGMAVALTSASPQIVSVPATVLVPPGATSVTFQVATIQSLSQRR